MDCSVKWRREDHGLFWAVIVEGKTLNLVHDERRLPQPGDRIIAGSDPPLEVTVATVEDGLVITTSHLEFREQFDPRRVYETPNSTRVVFKRVESGRVVLWSYKLQAEIMIGQNIELKRTDAVAQPTASTGRKMTQKIFAAWIISRDPDITGSALTAMLKEAFPGSAISSRHGPHYLSQSRSGKLPEPPSSDPRLWTATPSSDDEP